VRQAIYLRWKLLGRITLVQATAAAFLTVYLRSSGDPNALPNALFLVGMPCFLVGLWRIVRSMGFFNVVTYSFQRLRALQKSARNQGSIPPELSSLAEYNLSRAGRPVHYEYLIGGLLYILASVMTSFV